MSDNETGTRTRPARRRRSKVVPRIVAGGSVALLLTAGVLGYRASAEPAQARYRTVVAGPGTVSQTISLSGSVHHVSQVSVTFPTAGMVVSVSAKPGDTVAAGQPLAAIDSGPLQNAVLDAEAAWRAAVSKLNTDQTAYDSAQSSTTSTSTAGAGTANQASAGGNRTSGGAAASGQASTPAGSGSGRPSASASVSTPGQGGSSSGSTRPTGSSSIPTAPSTSASMPPAGSVEDAAKALAALQKTLDSVQPNFDAFVTQCLPNGLPSTVPSAVPSVVTVTATKTVTATATTTVTVTADPSSAQSGASTASTATTAAKTTTSAPATTNTGTAASGENARPLASGATVSPACKDAIAALAAMPQTLREQLATAESALVGAQASLTAQAAALQAQAQALNQQAAELQQQGAALQQQATALQQQAAALQQQAAELQAQSAALKAQGTAAAAQGGAAAAKLGAGGLSNVTEATLITDRANVASTALTLQQATDRLANSTVTSPIAGTVASVPWVTGQPTTASAAAIVIGPGAIEITVPVALAQRPQVEAGQAAVVTSPVSSQPLDGKVTRIGLLPISTSTTQSTVQNAAAQGAAAAGGSTTSTVSYPVVVTVAANGDVLPEGSRVQVGIVTAKVDAPVTVPASALTPTSVTAGTLQVFANGVAERRNVQIGISGGGVTQILSGLTAGESVVVADLELPLPGVTINTGRPSQQAQATGQGGGQFQPGQQQRDAQPTR